MTEAELMEALRVRFGKVRRGSKGFINIPCPTCLPKNKNKLKRSVSPYSSTSHCWICKEVLLVTTLLQSKDFQPAVQTSEMVQAIKEINPASLVMPGKRFIPVHELPPGHPAVRFLHKDHLFDLERYYQQNGMVYCPADAGQIFCSKPFVSSADRLVFPVHYEGKMVGWQMRSIPGTTFGDRPEAIRYYHLFNKGDYLYNYDNAIKYAMVVVTEGVKKALKFANGVATLGKGISAEQGQLMVRWRYVTLMLDSDEETQSEARTLCAGLGSSQCIGLNINLGDYGFPSPDEATSEQLNAILLKEWNKQGITKFV